MPKQKQMFPFDPNFTPKTIQRKVHGGADINELDSCGNTILYLAAKNNRKDLVEGCLTYPEIDPMLMPDNAYPFEFLDGDGDVHYDFGSQTAYNSVAHYLAHHGQVDCLIGLASRFPETLSVQNFKGNTPLHLLFAQHELSFATLKTLFAPHSFASPALSIKNNAQQTPHDTLLHNKSYKRQQQMISFLIPGARSVVSTSGATLFFHNSHADPKNLTRLIFEFSGIKP